MSVENMEKAKENRLLWPPISDAVDTYLRRRASNADGYELTWRLVHVWEAIAATLSAAAVTRLREEPKFEPLYRRAREYYHGRFWDPIAQGFNRSQSGLDGSATRRIDVLWDISNGDVSSSRFLTSLQSFLLAKEIDLSPLVKEWERICEVPDETKASGKFAVREALRHVNTFRNRFAHVPFPYDVLRDVSDAYARVTEQLFSFAPAPFSSFTQDESLESPLCGSILWKDRAMRGGENFRTVSEWPAGYGFSYPPIAKKSSPAESWSASPFVHVDSMLRPYVMTRLTSITSGTWEFTRFRAEASSVIAIQNAEAVADLPAPTQAEYSTPQDAADRAEAKEIEETVQAQAPSSATLAQDEPSSFDEALRFVRNEDFEPAIRYFQRYVEARPAYHIGWLRLGHAQRELAMRRRFADPEGAATLFDSAIESLSQATGHVERNRKAQALYERSKAYYHRGNFLSQHEDLGSASKDASEACDLSPDTSYESWREYVTNHAVALDAS